MADTKITALTNKATLAGDELFPIVHDPSGTPATQRTTTQSIADFRGGASDLGWINVKTDHNAAGDGSTDDTVAIQAAIDAAAAAGGGTIYFPAGVYVVGGALQDVSGANAQLCASEC